MSIFAPSNILFGYPGRIPRGQDFTATAHLKKPPQGGFCLSIVFLNEFLYEVLVLY